MFNIKCGEYMDPVLAEITNKTYDRLCELTKYYIEKHTNDVYIIYKKYSLNTSCMSLAKKKIHRRKYKKFIFFGKVVPECDSDFLLRAKLECIDFTTKYLKDKQITNMCSTDVDI